MEKAYWEWLKQNCPYKSKRARIEWMKGNLFPFDGSEWYRTAVPHLSNSRKTVVHWSVIFKAADGRVVHNGEWSPNRRSDAERNWGLGRE
jgi:hypothetical protein